MLAKIANPISFCLQVLLQPWTGLDIVARQAACQILIDRVTCTIYADFCTQVARPETTFFQLLQMLASVSQLP